MLVYIETDSQACTTAQYIATQLNTRPSKFQKIRHYDILQTQHVILT